MPIVTCGSIGDIITICTLIRSLAQALDEIRGSSSQYREIVQELRTLEATLREVKRLSDSYSDNPALQPLFRTVAQAVERCNTDVQSFLEKVSRYRRYLQEGGSGNLVKDSVFKVRWHLSHEDDIIPFRAHINAHTSCINVLLSAINL
jgi:Fungal N-terminal domain of STAND proteins